MFEGASNLAAGVDRAFVFIFTISGIFIVGITAFMIWTVIRFNRKKGKPAKKSRTQKGRAKRRNEWEDELAEW